MITNLKDFKILLEKKNKEASDIFIIDVVPNDINEEYTDNLNKYLENYPRTFNIYSNQDSKQNLFTNQVRSIKKQPNRELSISDVDQLFPEHMKSSVYNLLKNIPDDMTMFETIHNDYYIYLGKEKWLYIEKEIADILKTIKKLQRSIILLGKRQSLTYMFKIIRSFDIPVTINDEFTYSEQLPQDEDSVNESIDNISFEELHLDHHNSQDVMVMKMYKDKRLVAQADYSIYSGKIWIDMIEAFIKGKGYGPELMRELARRYGYENIERRSFTQDGIKMRQKLDKEFNFDYDEHLKKQNCHIDRTEIDEIKYKYIKSFLSDILLLGFKEALEKYRENQDLNNELNKINFDFNDIYDISKWIKHSPTNDNQDTDEVPEQIKNDFEILK